MNNFLKFFCIFLLFLLIVSFSSCYFVFGKTTPTEAGSEVTNDDTSNKISKESNDIQTTEEQKTEETFGKYPNPINYVSDFAEIIDSEYESRINALSEDLEKETTAQVCVVTVGSLEGKTIDKYANELFNQWGIGQKDKNNGVLFLVALQESKYRIEVGYGLESVITNEIAREILDEVVMPRFESGEFGLGSYECVEEISKLILLASE